MLSLKWGISVFRQYSSNSGKAQIHGHHKPKMLADQLRRRAPKKPAKKTQVKFIPQNINQLQPFINIDFSKLSNLNWPLIIVMLILIPGALADARIFNLIIEGISVNGNSVELLPADAQCKSNSLGDSKGKICVFDGARHYLKSVTPKQAASSLNSKSNEKQYISLEEFNRQFVKNNIGIDITDARYYKKSINDNKLYFGGRQVDGLMFTKPTKATNKQLGKAGVAKWAVAASFVVDLHYDNIGYTKNGIVLIDGDSNNLFPSLNIKSREVDAAYDINYLCPDLSIFDVKQMIEIYQEMKSKQLPEYHDEFNLTNKLYQEMLGIFINVCEAVIAKVAKDFPAMPETQRTPVINKLWCEIVKAGIPRSVVSQIDYNNLCNNRPVL